MDAYQNDKGSILLSTVVMLSFLLIIVSLGFNLVSTDHVMTDINYKTTRLFYYSEAGLNIGYKVLADKIIEEIETMENFEGEMYDKDIYMSQIFDYINNDMNEDIHTIADDIIEQATLSVNIRYPRYVDSDTYELKITSMSHDSTFSKELSQKFILYFPSNIEEVNDLNNLLVRYDWEIVQ